MADTNNEPTSPAGGAGIIHTNLGHIDVGPNGNMIPHFDAGDQAWVFCNMCFI